MIKVSEKSALQYTLSVVFALFFESSICYCQSYDSYIFSGQGQTAQFSINRNSLSTTHYGAYVEPFGASATYSNLTDDQDRYAISYFKDGNLFHSKSSSIHVTERYFNQADIILVRNQGALYFEMAGPPTLGSVSIPSAIDRIFPNVSFYPGGVGANEVIGSLVPASKVINIDSISKPILNGAEIRVKFEPKINGIPVNIKVLGDALGYHHFNWRQTMTIPEEWMRIKYDISTGSIVDSGTYKNGFLDPITDPNKLYAFRKKNGKPGGIGHPDDPPDTKDYYFNEGSDGTLSTELSKYTKDFHLDYYDRPTFHKNFYEEGDYISIRTELWGIRSDGTGENTGVGFQYKSNARALNPAKGIGLDGEVYDVSYLKALGDYTIGSTEGEIYDFEMFEVVPEPSTYALVIGICCIFLCSGKFRYAKASLN